MISADLLYMARNRAGLTQAELAARLGLTQSQLSRWERGRVEPSLETLRRIIRACGLELTLGLANGDDSYVALIDEYLGRSPRKRVDTAVSRAKVLSQLRPAIEAARG